MVDPLRLIHPTFLNMYLLFYLKIQGIKKMQIIGLVLGWVLGLFIVKILAEITGAIIYFLQYLSGNTPDQIAYRKTIKEKDDLIIKKNAELKRKEKIKATNKKIINEKIKEFQSNRINLDSTTKQEILKYLELNYKQHGDVHYLLNNNEPVKRFFSSDKLMEFLIQSTKNKMDKESLALDKEIQRLKDEYSISR